MLNASSRYWQPLHPDGESAQASTSVAGSFCPGQRDWVKLLASKRQIGFHPKRICGSAGEFGLTLRGILAQADRRVANSLNGSIRKFTVSVLLSS